MQIEGYLDFKWVRLTKEKYNTETKFASKPNDRQVVEAKCKKEINKTEHSAISWFIMEYTSH